MITAGYDRAATPSAELEAIEQAHALDPTLLYSGIFARAFVAFFRADLGAALALFERLVPESHVESAFHANLPGRVVALAHLACARWVIGEPERALEEASAALDLANRIELPILQALGHAVRARLRFLRRDPLELIEREAPAAVQATSVDLGLHTEARAVALWAQARRGPLELSAIQPMLDSLNERLTQVATSSTLVAQVLIEVLRLSGHLAEARKLTDEIIAFALAHNESVYLPELLRIRGEQVAASDPVGATRDYREAVRLARSTGARSLEQRANESLAALELPSGARRL